MKPVPYLVFLLFSVAGTHAIGQQNARGAPTDVRAEGLQISSDFLGGVVLGQKVELMLHDGTYVRGRVIRSSRDEITVRIKRSEPAGRIRGPEADLKSTEIAVVRMTRNGTAAAPIVLGVVGAIGALYAAAFAADDIHSEGAYVAISLVSAAGGATGGALLGREAARKTVTINVVPMSKGEP